MATDAQRDYIRDNELAVLGICMWDAALVRQAAELKPRDFGTPSHEIIWRWLTRMVKAGEPVDPSLLIQALRRDNAIEGAGGAEAVSAISSHPLAGDPRRLDTFVGEVVKASSDREYQLLGALRAEGKLTYEERKAKVDALTVETERRLGPGKHLPTLDNTADELLAEFDNPISKPDLPFGFPELDDLTGGMAPGELILVPADTGTGKSAFVGQVGVNVAHICKKNPGAFGASPGKPGHVLFFSYEMTSKELLLRMTSQCSPVTGYWDKRRGGWLSADLSIAKRGLSAVRDLPIRIENASGLTVEDIRAITERFSLTEGRPSLVIVDHIGIVKKPGTDPVNELGIIANGLKQMAVAVEVPVLLAAQINREAGNRDDHQPKMSDIRMSGEIEHASNKIIFIYRPSKYIKDYDQRKRVQSDPNGEWVSLLVAKSRSGSEGRVAVKFIGRRTLFVPNPLYQPPYGPLPFDGPGIIDYPILDGWEAEGSGGTSGAAAVPQPPTRFEKAITQLRAMQSQAGQAFDRRAINVALEYKPGQNWKPKDEKSRLAREDHERFEALIDRGEVKTETDRRTNLYWFVDIPRFQRLSANGSAVEVATFDASTIATTVAQIQGGTPPDDALFD